MSDVLAPPATFDPPSDTAEPQPSGLTGLALIQDEVKRLPDAPGVYRMIGAEAEVLYVGKARSLKKRVGHYAQGRFHSQRIGHMVALTRSMEFITTETEAQALLLESNLIKRLKPRFNVVLRDDKSFAEILLRRDHPAPQVRKHRGAHTIKGDYFGPFASTWAVNRTVNILQKAFLLRSCSDSVYDSRTRPCMLHQIKRCSAPCTGLISQDDYAKLADEAHQFLCGKSRSVLQRLSQDMTQAAEDMEFERAAKLRDRIRALSAISMEQSINPETVEEADVFALHVEGGQACVQVFFFRAGQNWGNRAYFPRVNTMVSEVESLVEDAPATEFSPTEAPVHAGENPTHPPLMTDTPPADECGAIMDAFLGQFYEDKLVPRLVLLSHEAPNRVLLAEAFCVKSGHRVEIATPRRGEKRELVAHALTNAREALGRRMAEGSAQARLLSGVAEAFKLDGSPDRIEVYDNSHIMGTNAVGAMIVAGPDGFAKSSYRKFNIRGTDLTPGDDFGMMREVMRRRFGRLVKEEETGETPPRPDLVLVDGGAGQLDAALTILRDLGLHDIPCVGVAKGPDRDAGLERFFVPGAPAPFMFEPKSPILYYLQRLRDEAHRFAIGTHRIKRKLDMARNPLDEIEGVGPGRKRALLHAFGSARGVSRASAADLAKVEGVNEALAGRIYGFFHKAG
ncbi:excinuclease ABC subunit UvrC [Caulobacter sp. S45]|uniref:excinuclease ABC subunit UvrC n=1 Tax=Caulobacter sp. S45 TaxID=1641861 RepID=UPI001575DC21|nr:excinuclease ABC subunit UvrC [Caulobacter sp. S45]